MKNGKTTKTKIAIACQGGGSQTAFTAGVLSSFFENKVHLKKKIVGLSGTSGGAICASLAWFGLLKAAQGDDTPIQKRIIDFWEDIIAKLPPEAFFDKFVAEMMRLVDKGMLPHYETSPESPFSQMLMSNLSSAMPRKFFTDLKAALEEHIDFEELPNLVKPHSPVLIVGAADGTSRTKPVTVRFVHISPELQSTLDYVSKLSRQPAKIYELIEDGKKQGQNFLESLSKEGNGKPEPARANRRADGKMTARRRARKLTVLQS